MSIATEIERIKTNIVNAYEKLSEKGATLPTTQNSASLVDTIDSIQSESTETPTIIKDSIVTAEIPETFTSIAKSSFKDCKKLESVAIPDSITIIGSGAFSGCSSLTSVVIPTSVTNVGLGAFKDCSSLPSITIPNSVTTINMGAFSGCSNLNNITYWGTVEEWNNIVKLSGWNSDSGIVTITCTDGVIEV